MSGPSGCARWSASWSGSPPSGVERGTPLIAVGGGTIGDLAGTAAALYARGLPLVHVPTTWLAQADSAIGGKVAVDLGGGEERGRRLLAAGRRRLRRGRPPDRCRVRLRRDGMAESLKAGIIGDPALWRLLEERGAKALRTDEPARYAILERSVRVKLAVCERDPFETGERRTLNLGHTIGHALEIESRYRLPHGAAVALGMRAVAAIAAAARCRPGPRPRASTACSSGSASRCDAPSTPRRCVRRLLGDKKRARTAASAGSCRWRSAA